MKRNVRKKEEAKKQIQFMSLEDLVPENHLVRKLEKAIDLSFIYEEVKELIQYPHELYHKVYLVRLLLMPKIKNNI